MGAHAIKRRKTKLKKKLRKSSAVNIGSKRKLDRFGKRLKKGRKGETALFITRGQALRKLQLSLKDFRKLCILKGIYPRDPKKKSKGHDKTYYHVKDILYLSHEPLLNKYRELKVLLAKIKKNSVKGAVGDAKEQYDSLPEYNLDHIIKERYPAFTEALSDMDDALSLVYLYSTLPCEGAVHYNDTIISQKLCKEWEFYISYFRLLKKTFISIKGIYYQCEIQGMKITWLVPHEFTPYVPVNVDIKIMNTFVKFYIEFLKFIFYKLYTDKNLQYPPTMDNNLLLKGGHLSSIQINTLNSNINQDLSKENQNETIDQEFIDNPESRAIIEKQEKANQLANLFNKLVFFLNREVPKKSLEFIIKSFGGIVISESETYDANNKYKQYKDKITHHVVDRPMISEILPNREYIQPQWVYDSINSGILLPIYRYKVGQKLPPHLSPFINDKEEGYIPEYRKELDKLISAYENKHSNIISTSDTNNNETVDEVFADSDEIARKRKRELDEIENRELRETMLTKKTKRLHTRIQHSLHQKQEHNQLLAAKKRKIEKESKSGN